MEGGDVHLLIAVLRTKHSVVGILELHADPNALPDGNLVGALHLPYLPISPHLLLVTATSRNKRLHVHKALGGLEAVLALSNAL